MQVISRSSKELGTCYVEKGDQMAAEHVADDWREALEDLREPSEATISNLVSIARDALEYANAIAMTTIEHIKKVKHI